MFSRRAFVHRALAAALYPSVALSQGRRISLSDFNADASGATDASGPIMEWLAAGHGSGRELYIGPGDYLLENPVVFQARHDLTIISDERARVFSGDKIGTPLISLRGPRQEPYPSVKWTGGRIDNSRGIFRDNDQTNSCLELIRLANSSVREARFGTPFHWRDERADSGVTPQSVRGLVIEYCVFEGLSGTAVYASGGARPDHDDDGGDILVANCIMRRCRQAATIKRDARGMSFTRNEVEDALVGVSTLEAGGLGPGLGLSVTSNKISRTTWSAITVRGQSGVEISNNTLTDCGLNSDGTPSEFAQAIRILGSEGANVVRNRVSLSRRDQGKKCIGVFLAPTKILGKNYRNGANQVRDNDISRVGIGIWSRDGPPDFDFGGNRFHEVGQEIYQLP